MHAFDFKSALAFAKRETGLLSALLFVALTLWGFLHIAEEVGEGDTRSFDTFVLLAMRTGDSHDPVGPAWLEFAARDITALGGFAVLTLLTLLALGFLLVTKKYVDGLLLLAAVLGATALSEGLKLGYARPRPDLVAHAVETLGSSFPSGHATLSAATYLTIGALLAHAQERPRVKTYIHTASIVLALLIGVSRVYLGVHWPTVRHLRERGELAHSRSRRYTGVMSIRPGDEKTPNELPEDGAVMETIVPKPRDLGDNFMVRRALPAIERRMIGPFVFWDEFGPGRFEAGKGLDVRPHPHINLATVTYLFDGEIFHRDTLGSAQAIKPGDVNWMNAGRGIAHSERTAPDLRASGSPIGGIQSWVALPEAHEESAPFFKHHAGSELPFIEGEGKRVRVIAGKLFGQQSPVQTYSEMFYADVRLEAGASLPLDTDHEERGVYLVSGTIEVSGETHDAGRLLYFRPGAAVTIRAQTPARFMALGGAVLGPRHVWWNFVSSRKERIEQAKEDWKAGRFGTVPGDDQEFIPLPD